ncbi:uracil-DNA glycosylase [Salinisphaera sp. Q1T1-3]|uniref:uracil-DNA glycosylase n=1 Tax=Salinisphaera sp. Q1T1-3 TaxID=2321229 RepID=UPI000E7200C9|nr:uracil-DNA glycosylase [Salinisphaera sp. Q1T1-3]RJS93761.1 uracil-DNA glycosylase [Salinisphaera sp. Q1T1-3]
MDETLDRRALLAALGLTDWRIRDAGTLGLARAAEAADERSAAALGPSMQDPAPDPAETAGEPPSTVEPPMAAPSATDEPIDTSHAPESSAAAEPEARFASDAAAAAIGPTPPSSSEDPATLGWDALEAWLGQQDHRGASRPVFGIGARDADVLIVGEAPGANEDAQGVPFVGRAGKLLDRMLFAIGCSRETNVYITNICKFRPPDNRDPNADEVAADWPVLERQIDLMQPKLVVAVGRIAAQTLLDCKTPLGKLRGALHRYPRRDLDVLVSYHPAYLLRSPDQKARAWADLKRIARHIGSLDS